MAPGISWIPYTDECSGYGCAELELSVGRVKGNSWSHGEEYLMIPYASAERFEAPVVSKNLTPGRGRTFDATNIDPYGGAACLQPPFSRNQTSYGVEECLIMNLYKPLKDAPAEGTRPILIWIFGGNNDASEIIPYNATMLAG